MEISTVRLETVVHPPPEPPEGFRLVRFDVGGRSYMPHQFADAVREWIGQGMNRVSLWAAYVGHEEKAEDGTSSQEDRYAMWNHTIGRWSK